MNIHKQKTILIIYPHWPPSNLAGVHRPRLIANYLMDFGWQPVVLTVEPQFYEEPADYDLCKLVNSKIEVVYTKAYKVTKPRIFGDIGIRAFSFLYKKALEIIANRKIDFVWIPIPSFYTAVLGRLLYNKTRTPYGIDYIDPWIRNISNRRNLRAILSNLVAHILEPFAVGRASVISAVAYEYYKPVVDKYFRRKSIIHVAMPYGFDPNDHQTQLESFIPLWYDVDDCIPIVYAGAFLPLSGYFIDTLFAVIADALKNNILKTNIHLYFVGTGNYIHKSIEQYAIENKIDNIVTEIRDRKPYLYVLNLLSASKGVMVIGSTQKHYTASKIFQALLSQRPVFAIMHHQSTVVNILRETNADRYCCLYSENVTTTEFYENVKQKFLAFVNSTPNDWQPNLSALQQYSSKQSARKLVEAIEKSLNIPQ